MIVYFATDHAGFDLKNELLQFVQSELEYEVVDCGAHILDPNDDYPDFIALAAKAVSADPENTCAIILGSSGQGEAMVANRFPHVRATVYYGSEPEIIMLSREHNNANILAIGARFVDPVTAREMVRVWLTTPFSDEERHTRRIEKF